MIRDRNHDQVLSAEEMFIFGRNALGSITEVTSRTGILKQRLRYSSYGDTKLGKTDTDRLDEREFIEAYYGFAGLTQETEIGLACSGPEGNRCLDPNTGRWLQEDRIGFRGGDPNLYRYIFNNPLISADPTGMKPPITPNPIDYRQNIEEAATMWPWDFANAVKTGGKWDYKHREGYGKNATRDNQTAYRNAGNYNYGLTGRSCGFSSDTLRRAAGAYQWWEGKSLPEFGRPWGGPPYGDTPIDQFWINEGIKDFESGYFNRK